MSNAFRLLILGSLNLVSLLLIPFVLLQVCYAIARSHVAGFLKEKNIKVKDNDWR